MSKYIVSEDEIIKIVQEGMKCIEEFDPENLISNKISYAIELDRCYKREEMLKNKIIKLEKRNRLLEDKYSNIRDLALEPWETYAPVEDRMGR